MLIRWWSRCAQRANSPGHCSKVMLALAAPTLAQKPPGSHKSHAIAPDELLKVPTPHGSHSELPSLAAYCPGKQSMQTAPVLSARFPDGHASQPVLPALLL